MLTSMINRALSENEKMEAVGALWVLAFDEDNRTKMRETEGLVDLLKSLKDSDNDEVQKAASGALWEIVGKESHSESIEGRYNNLVVQILHGRFCQIHCIFGPVSTVDQFIS